VTTNPVRLHARPSRVPTQVEGKETHECALSGECCQRNELTRPVLKQSVDPLYVSCWISQVSATRTFAQQRVRCLRLRLRKIGVSRALANGDTVCFSSDDTRSAFRLHTRALLSFLESQNRDFTRHSRDAKIQFRSPRAGSRDYRRCGLPNSRADSKLLLVGDLAD